MIDHFCLSLRQVARADSDKFVLAARVVIKLYGATLSRAKNRPLTFCLCFKTSPGAKPIIWKWILSTRKRWISKRNVCTWPHFWHFLHLPDSSHYDWINSGWSNLHFLLQKFSRKNPKHFQRTYVPLKRGSQTVGNLARDSRRFLQTYFRIKSFSQRQLFPV